MIAYFKKLLFLTLLPSTVLFTSCGNTAGAGGTTAYFGGEIINPNSKYVYLCKDSEVIDTIELDKDNRFLQKYDTLSPGMYTFKHEPEYQYIYFDKGDSLMIRLNTSDFDNSLTFCGRGDEKNNFLIDLFLKNENEKNSSFDIYDYDLKKFEAKIDDAHKAKKAYYERRKEVINWSDDFDLYAKSMLEMSYFAKKEMYPMVHKFRTSNDVCKVLPKNYYCFRKEIDFNNKKLTHFAPFVGYLTSMLNNVTCKDNNTYSLENNIKKLKVADSLFTNNSIKNSVLYNIAFMYLLEDQNIVHNKAFLDQYYRLSTDKISKEKIKKIGNSVQILAKSKNLPSIDLIGFDGKKSTTLNTNGKKTVVFFWTSEAKSHMEFAHKRANELKVKHPELNFVAVNIDNTDAHWKEIVSNYKFNITELHAVNFDEIKEKWVITKIHRTMIINADGTISNAFVSLFDANFENYLK
ncbi:MAG: thioredoxin-like domain-containing protein [Bacteroidota bacterium]